VAIENIPNDPAAWVFRTGIDDCVELDRGLPFAGVDLLDHYSEYV
jgi:hypothetical protein